MKPANQVMTINVAGGSISAAGKESIRPHGLSCRFVGVGIGERFGTEITLIVDLLQRIDDRLHVHVPQPNGPSIAVDKVDVADVRSSVDQGIGDIGFFDVHVKEIREQSHVVRR